MNNTVEQELNILTVALMDVTEVNNSWCGEGRLLWKQAGCLYILVFGSF
jgi:hypothetical protein